jgi:hypothetical protein
VCASPEWRGFALKVREFRCAHARHKRFGACVCRLQLPRSRRQTGCVTSVAHDGWQPVCCMCSSRFGVLLRSSPWPCVVFGQYVAAGTFSVLVAREALVAGARHFGESGSAAHTCGGGLRSKACSGVPGTQETAVPPLRGGDSEGDVLMLDSNRWACSGRV